MASVRKRGDTWSFRLSLNDPRTGKRVQPERGGFKTKRAAEQAAKILEAEILGGTFVREEEILFKDFALRWLEIYKADGKKKASSVEVRQVDINRISKRFAFAKIRSITGMQYQDMLNDLRDQGYKKNTLISTNATASLVFAKAVELEVIKKDPTLRAVIPDKEKTVEEIESEGRIPRYLEKEELKKFLSFARHNRDFHEFARYHVLAYTGMRIGEMCALKWSDIDFEGQTISITKTLSTKHGGVGRYQIQTPKTKSSRRVVEIDSATIDVLKEWKSRQNEYKMKKRREYDDQNFVFVNMFHYPGMPATPRTLQFRMRTALELCELPKLTPHSFRHTHVSLMAEIKVELETIQERLGHKSDAITREIYLHITKRSKREAADRFASFMES